MHWFKFRRPLTRRAQSSPVVLVLAAVGLALIAALEMDGRRPFMPPPVHAQGGGYSLRLYGSGVAAPGLDRVIIPIDAPARPADLGATDFTIEFWVKAFASENPGAVQCNTNAGWITGNTLIDRDIYGDGDYGDFGIALGGGRIAFGVSVGTSGTTLCGTTVVADGRWHHVAAVRRLTGALQLYVDGVPDGSIQGPGGDASYRDGRSSIYPFDPTLVLGAEKHDAGAEYPSFSGWLDELRLSTTARYSAAFVPPSAPFVTDGATAALYHFDEGPAGACQGAILDVSGAAGGPSNGTCRYGGVTLAGPVYTTDQPFTSTPPTATNTATSVPPTSTSTATPVPPTGTSTVTPVLPTSTHTATSVPSTATGTVTSAPPTSTSTATPVPPTATGTTIPPGPTATHTGTAPPSTGTSTPTPSSPTATGTSVAETTATATPSTPAVTSTPADNTATSTATFTPTSTDTPGGTIPPAPSSTPVGAATPDPGMLPTLAPCPTSKVTPSTTPPATPAMEQSVQTLYLPAIQVYDPCAITTIPD